MRDIAPPITAGLAARRIEALTPEGQLRLASAHPDCATRGHPSDEVRIVGKTPVDCPRLSATPA